MPDRTILAAQGATAAPFAYTVPTADGMTPGSVFAQWDGSGASGDFLPCVSYYDQHGILLYRAFPDGVTLTAGDSAEVSYGPFKRGGGTGGGAALTTTDGATTVNPTTTLSINGGLTLANLGGGTAEISAPPATLIYSTAYCTSQTSASTGGINFPRVNLVQLRGNGVTYGHSTHGNLGTTWTITASGIYIIGYNIAAMVTDDDGEPADLGFGPDGGGGGWSPGDFPFGLNDRFRVAEQWNVQGLGVGGPQGGMFTLHLTAGETLSWSLGSGAAGINITVDHGLFSLVKVG